MYGRLCTFLLAGGILANELDIINELGITEEELFNAKKSGSPYKKSGYYGSNKQPLSSLKKTLGDMVVTTGQEDNENMNSEEMDIALSKMITDMRAEQNDGAENNGEFLDQPEIKLKQAGSKKVYNDERDNMTLIPLYGMLLSEDKTKLYFQENLTWCIRPEKVDIAWKYIYYNVDPVDLMPISINNLWDRNVIKANIFNNNSCRNRWKNVSLNRNFAAKKRIWEAQYQYSVITVARHFVNDDHKKKLYVRLSGKSKVKFKKINNIFLIPCSYGIITVMLMK